jgi:hypothetical protein
MIPFYLYFLLLSYTVSDWLAEYEGQEMSKERKERKREEARRIKEEEWL